MNMFGKLSYAFLIVVFTLLPLAYILLKHRRLLGRYRRMIALLAVLWFVSAMVIDHYTREKGFWFNPAETNIGVFILGVPLEDAVASALIGVLLPSLTLVLSSEPNTRKR